MESVAFSQPVFHMVGVVLGEVKVFGGFLFEFSDFFLFQRFSCTVKQRADGFESFRPDAFFDFFAFKF